MYQHEAQRQTKRTSSNCTGVSSRLTSVKMAYSLAIKISHLIKIFNHWDHQFLKVSLIGENSIWVYSFVIVNFFLVPFITSGKAREWFPHQIPRSLIVSILWGRRKWDTAKTAHHLIVERYIFLFVLAITPAKSWIPYLKAFELQLKRFVWKLQCIVGLETRKFKLREASRI